MDEPSVSQADRSPWERPHNPEKICAGCGGKITNRSGTRHKYCTRECFLSKPHPNQHKHPMFKTWKCMMNRCYRLADIGYHNYGGRGITVCVAWHNFETFGNWALAQPRDPGMTLDRKNNDLGYSPENCHFTTRQKQQRNKRGNLILELFGERKTAIEWSEDSRCAGTYHLLVNRMRRGISLETALTTPPLSNTGRLPRKQ